MSIRTTVTLEEDVLERLKEHSRSKGISFKQAINDVLRAGLVNRKPPPGKRWLGVEPREMGLFPGLNYDDIESLIEYAEGPFHR